MSDFRPGDARLTVNGESVTLRLTLGALAEIEDRLGGGDFSALARLLEKPGVGHLLVLIEALSAGGGRRLSAHELTTAAIDLADAARAVAKAFAALAPQSPSPACGRGVRGEGALTGAGSHSHAPSPPAPLPLKRERGEGALS
jgi:hypothetical protein